MGTPETKTKEAKPGLAEKFFLDQENIGGAKFSDHEERLIRLGYWKRPRQRRGKPNDHELWYLVEWYLELRSANPVGFGHGPIAYSEIIAFRDLYGLDIDAFDTDTLRRLDTLWLKLRPKDESRSSSGDKKRGELPNARP